MKKSILFLLLSFTSANAQVFPPMVPSGGGGSTSPGGSTTQCQYNNAGSFGGITGCTTNGTAVTLVAPVLGTPASGVATNLTGTAAGLTAGNVTTNANLTGVITSSGNATSIASQTGTGTKFVVDTTPTLITPVLGVATGTSFALGGATIGSNALAVTGTSAFSGTLIVGTTSSGIELGASSQRVLTFYNSAGPNISSRIMGDSTGGGGPSRWQLGSTGTLEWNSAASITTGAIDTILSRNAAGIVQFGTTAANALGSLMAVNGTYTGTILTSSTTDATTTTSGALQVAGGMAVRKRVFIDGITTSSGLQTAVLCQSSGGEMIADSVACLASAVKFKNVHGAMPDGALAKLMLLPIDLWSYKAEGNFITDDWTRERIGPLADDVAAMDRRLVGYDSDGNVRTYSTEQLLAYTIKAVQELKADNDNLRLELRQHRVTR